jgi:hypothetical protein
MSGLQTGCETCERPFIFGCSCDDGETLKNKANHVDMLLGLGSKLSLRLRTKLPSDHPTLNFWLNF